MIVSLKCAFPSASFPRLRPRISLLASSLLSSSSWSIHKNLLFKTFKKSSKKQIETEWKRITDDNRTQGKHLCRYWIGSSWCWIASFCFHGAKTSVHKLRDYTPKVFNKKTGALSDTILAGGKASKKIVLWFRVWRPTNFHGFSTIFMSELPSEPFVTLRPHHSHFHWIPPDQSRQGTQKWLITLYKKGLSRF